MTDDRKATLQRMMDNVDKRSDVSTEAFDDLSALHERLELAVKRAERAEARLSEFKLVYVHSLRTLVPENLLPLVETLQGRVADMLSVLKAVEWSAFDTWNDDSDATDCCPMCQNEQEKGHQDDCPLQAAIKKAEGKEPALSGGAA